MSEPSDVLRQLAARGRQIRASMIQNYETQKSIPERVATGVDMLDLFFDLSGYKRSAVRAGKALVQDSATQRQKHLEQEREDWTSQVKGNLRKISEVKRGLTGAGNSLRLAGRFMKTQRFVRPTTQLAHGIAFLEELSEKRVVWNEDIPEVLSKPGYPREKAMYETETQELIAPAIIDSKSLASLLAGHPSELEAIRGAIAAHEAGTPDSGRQALNSCRNAIENLVKRLSGETNWARGLEKIAAGDTRRKTVRQAYSFLSAYGTHGIANPSRTDVELGIRMTVAVIQSILEWGRQLS